MRKVRIRDFVNSDLRGASDYFNRRSLPHIIDGLKTGQRKVIDAAVDMSSADKIKVSSLAARAVETKAYHHGDVSLMKTTVGLAQGFPGTNNVPLLDPLGSFGSAKKKDSASPRYISTRLSENFWKYFNKDDQKVITRLYDDGDPVEPEFFIPMLPILLINGSDGTGSGYKSFILPYKPSDIREAILSIIDTGAVQKPLAPWMNGWKGTVSKDPATGQATFYGVIEIQTKTKILITELPPKHDLVKFKTHLNSLVEKGTIKDYTNQSEIGGWQIEINCTREFTDTNSKERLLEILGLVQRETETIVCWGVDRKIRVFNTVEELLLEWYQERLKFSALSLANKIDETKEKLLWLRIKRNFISWWSDNADEIIQWDSKKIKETALKEVSLLDANAKYLTRLTEIKIFNLANDETDMLNNQINAVEKEFNELCSFTPASWYRKGIEGVGLA